MNTLEKTLNDFALDLINHCAVVKNGEIILPEEGLKNLIRTYLKIDDPVIWPITQALVQLEAESEIDRELTNIELNRLKEMFYDDEKVSWNRMVMIREAMSEVIDNSNHQWDEIDKDHQDEMLKGGEK